MKNFYASGDNVPVKASLLVFPAHAAGDTYTNLVGPGQGLATPINLPESGDPVVVGSLVGVVNNDALTGNDIVIVSTRGVYQLAVVGKSTSGANVAVALGDEIFIDPVSAALTKDSTKVPFGIALGTVVAGATTTIPVKLWASSSPSGTQVAAGSYGAFEVDAASAAIAIKSGTVIINKAGSLAAMTLAVPTAGADDGKELTIIAATAFAHTVTTPANGINGNKSVITFGAAAGNQVTLVAFNGAWYVRNPATADGFTLA